MRIVVTGHRNYYDRKRVYEILDMYHKKRNIEFIGVGDARGVDTITREWCIDRGVPYAVFFALWDKLGRRAGPNRNQFMLTVTEPDLVIAIHPDIENSKGTKNCVSQALKNGIEVQGYQ